MADFFLVDARRNAPRPASAGPKRQLLSTLFGVCVATLVGLVLWEANTHGFQARQLAGISGSVSYAMAPGLSPSIRFPRFGPYDERLGYTRLPRFLERLEEHGYEIVAQSRFSPGMRKLSDWGVFPIYREKTQAGLRVLDSRDRPFFEAVHPPRVFASAKAVPKVVVDTLLFIENRELLGGSRWRNPAIELTRLARAGIDYGLKQVRNNVAVPGASTLATQLEKFRHSPGGLTGSPREKLRQMATASLRAYREGPDTTDTRRQIVVDYLDSIGLAAVPGHGEVIGLASGLALWHGARLEEVVEVLALPEAERDGVALHEQARAYKQILSLLLAAKRPTYFLVEHREALVRRTDAFLRLMAEQGVINERLRDTALATYLHFKSGTRSARTAGSGARRAAGPVRARLVRILGLSDYYELERLDLTVRSTVDRRVQLEAARALEALRTRAGAARAGLAGPRMLAGADPSHVVYGLVVYERGPEANRLRVQTDTLDSAFDINDLLMLDLGSTAKLRTLASYLEAVARLYARLGELSTDDLRALEIHPRDALSAWAVDHMISSRRAGLSAMLEAALERRYSANPDEKFFTGGGVHIFRNFDDADDTRVVSVRDAFRHSINLPFIRLMRDLVDHIIYTTPTIAAESLDDDLHSERERYLWRYAGRDGAAYLERFYSRYHGLAATAMLAKLIAGKHHSTAEVAAILRATRRHLDRAEFKRLLKVHAGSRAVRRLGEVGLRVLYDSADPSRYSLAERAYVTDVHPLELWTVGFLLHSPGATRSELHDAAHAAVRDSYEWLFATGHKSIQQRAISSELEIDAFAELHKQWRDLGYPFGSLVPSFATAIGTSADRPAALAELAGIIINDGIRQPSVRLENLRFAEGTPYETIVGPRRGDSRRVIHAEVAQILARMLVETVDLGTGRRARVLMLDAGGWPLAVGGKTGTGDHYHKLVGADGEVLESYAVSRSAAFVFTLGDRFFGAVTAYVLGEEAADYSFTSSLATQVFRVLAPTLEPLLAAPPLATASARGGTGHARRPSARNFSTDS